MSYSITESYLHDKDLRSLVNSAAHHSP